MQILKLIQHFVIFVLFLFPLINTHAQTSLEPGDLAVVGVNANNFACSGTNGEDLISFVCFKDITNGTTIDISDNGWERLNANQFGDSEGTVRATYAGATIPAGQVITFVSNNGGSYSIITHSGWTFMSLNDPPGLTTTLNLNVGGDQLYFMQGGVWDYGNPTIGTHDATYSGRVLFGFNSKTNWNPFINDSRESGLHPDVIPCYHMEPSSGQTDYFKYTGIMTPATQVEWISRIRDANNWTSYPGSCANYNNALPDFTGLVTLPILQSEMSIDCTVCSAGCSAVNETLVFNLPSVGGPFDVIYTDGVNPPITLTGIVDGHTEMVTVTSTTTFSLVTVTSADGCPTYSNFGGSATVTVSGTGGASASLTGGGILCSGNCSDVTVNISGGTAPYTIGATLNFPGIPLLNNFPVTGIAPNTMFTITICSQGNLPIPTYNTATNTLTIDESLASNGTITLTSISDNSGCAGTVTPTPLSMNIVTAPTANTASISECANANGTTTYNLVTLNNTVNGNSGNTVAWFQDINATNQITTPNSFTTTLTTVYAVVSNTDCDSEPVAVTLMSTPSPTAMPTSLTECESSIPNQATFNLTAINNTVNGNSGLPVSWFSNAAMTIPIPTGMTTAPNNTTVYATVGTAPCISQPVAVTLTVTPAPSGTTTTLQECSSAPLAIFDLTQTNALVSGGIGSVSWFTNASATSQIFTPATHSSGTNIVYAVIDNNGCLSQPVPVNLVVNAAPFGNQTIMSVCEANGLPNNGIFNLPSVNNIVNGNTSEPVNWFLDLNGIAAVPNPNAHIATNNSVVYAVVGTAPCISTPVAVMLEVTALPSANPTTIDECAVSNNQAVFNLTAVENTVNGNSGNTVNWFVDMNGIIPINSSTLSTYLSTSTQVYASVANGNCESGLVPIILNVVASPIGNPTSDSECDNGTGVAVFNLSSLNNAISSDPNNTIAWYTDNLGTVPAPDPFTTSGTTVYAVVDNGSCNSVPIPIPLTLETAPTANTTSSTLCDTGTGTASFNLSSLNNAVNSNATNTITWFTDILGTVPAADPFITSGATVYAVVDNGACTSAPTAVNLIVENAPSATAASASACDTGGGMASFNLSNLNNQVNGNSGNTVLYYLDNMATVPAADPLSSSTVTIYAVVDNGSCTSAITPISLTVENAPSAIPTSETVCDNGSGTGVFDLSSLNNIVNANSSNTVSWYTDNMATIPAADPLTSAATTVYAVVDNGTCTSVPIPISLFLENAPLANSTTSTLCDSGSGSAIFNLTNLNNDVNGNTTNGVFWFTDVSATTPAPNPFSTGTTTVYAVVDNGTCTSAPTLVNLNVVNAPTASATSATLCDDGTGTATFDLTSLENTINGNSGNPVNWFADASASITIPTTYNTGTANVYAIVENGTCTSSVVTIPLMVNNLPIANSTTSSECDNGTGTADFNLNNLATAVNGNTSNTVNWYSDMNLTTPIVSPFNSASTTIYAVVTDGTCTAVAVPVMLSVGNGLTANSTTEELCDDGTGTASFNLTSLENTVNGGTGNTVTWFSDVAATLPIASPIVTGTTTVYAVVTSGNCSSTPSPINLVVGNIPMSTITTDEQCDIGNGTASFNLNNIANIVNGGNGNTVNWFSDPAATLPIASPFNSTSTSVYAVVVDGNCSSAPTEIMLNVSNNLIANSTTDEQCDDGTGIASFDLNNLANTVNGGNGNTVNWFSDPAATLPITSPFSSTSTSVYAVVVDGNCSSTPTEIMLNVSNNLIANSTTDEQCDDGTGIATFDLNNLANTVNGGNGNTVNWFSDPAATLPIASPFNSTSTSVYAVVVDGNCSSTPTEIMLNVSNNLIANSTTDEQCDDGTGIAIFDLNNLANTVNGGNGNTVNWFSDPAATLPIASPFSSTSTSVYAVVVDGNCSSTPTEIMLNVSNNLIANSTTDEQCDDGTGIAIFDLNNLANTVNGGNGNTVNWFSDPTATLPIASPFSSTSTSVYAVVVDGNCSSTPTEIMLNVSNNLIANSTTDEQCDDGTGIASFDLNNLANTVNGGNGNTVNWFSDPAATLPIASPFNSTSTSVYAVVVDGNCSSTPTEIMLNVSNNLIANSTTDEQCDDGTGIAIFDLNNLANTVNGGNGNTVNWFSDPTATLPIASPFSSTSTSVYAVVVDGNCSSTPTEIMLNVSNNLIANSTTDEQCDDGTGIAIFDLNSLANTVNGGNGNTVNWFSDPAATLPIASPFNSTSTSVYAVVVDGNCSSTPTEIMLNVSNNLIANSTTDEQCDDGTGIAIFDLNNLANTVNGGNGNTVNWFSDPAATLPIASPFSSTSTSVYAVVVDGNCSSTPTEIMLNVSNNLIANSTTDEQCDDGTGIAIFDLNNLANTVNGGNGNTVNWFSDPAATLPIASPFSSTSTSVYAVVVDGNCSSTPTEIMLNVSNNLIANSTTDEQCDDGTGIAIFDLNNLANTVNGGNGNTVNWFSDPAATLPITSPFSSVSTSVYAVVVDGNCSSNPAEVMLQVTNIITANPTSDIQCDLGNGNAVFDLDNLANIVNGGNGNTVNWFFDAAATLPIASPFNSSTTSVYAVVVDGNCSSAPVEVMLDIENPISGSLAVALDNMCPGSSNSLIFTFSENVPVDIQFTDNINPTVSLTGVTTGFSVPIFPTTTTTYTLLSVVPQGSNCQGTVALNQATVTVSDISATANATSDYNGFEVSCKSNNDGSAIAIANSGVAPFIYNWSNGSQNENIENLASGSYTVTITDAAGCTASATTILTEPTPIQIDASATSPLCLFDTDGSITLENISGGVGPYEYSFDGITFSPFDNNTITVDQLTAGLYDINIIDGNDCVANDNIIVTSASALSLELGDNLTIDFGDSIQLVPQTNFTPVEIIWSSNITCDNCPTVFVRPFDVTTYEVTMIDENGCSITDVITIDVQKARDVFIPNGFSPDDNGINDIFYIHAGKEVAKVNTFRIFSRWGEVIFERNNFQPNIPALGWDGFFNKKKLNPGVYVYFAEIEFLDGVKVKYQGDISLVR